MKCDHKMEYMDL